MFNEFSWALESSFYYSVLRPLKLELLGYRSTFIRLSPDLYLIKTCDRYVFLHVHASVVQATFQHFNTRTLLLQFII